MSVAILVPVLRRPHRAGPLLDNIETTTPEPHRVLFLVDRDDPAERDAVIGAHGEMIVGEWPRPNYPAKINSGVSGTDDPFVFLAADDLVFHDGWLTAALALMDDPRVGVVGTNDGGVNPRVAAGQHSTHSLVRRAYIETCGTIDTPGLCVHPEYRHAFVDDELIGTARARGAYAHAHDSIVEHRHPYANDGVPLDSTYRLGMAHIAADQRLWARRRRLIRRHPVRAQ